MRPTCAAAIRPEQKGGEAARLGSRRNACSLPGSVYSPAAGGAGGGGVREQHTDPAKKLHQPPTDPPLLCSFIIPGNFGFLPLNLEKWRNSGNRDTLSLSVPKRNSTLCFSSSGHHWTSPAVCFAHRPDKPLNDATRMINLQLRRRAVTGAQTGSRLGSRRSQLFLLCEGACVSVCVFVCFF